MTRNRDSHSNGFSLIELIVVIALISIISAFTIPSLISWRSDKILDQASSEVLAAIRQARSVAIKTNQDVVLSFNPSKDNYSLFYHNGDDTELCSKESDEAMILEKKIPDGVELISAFFSFKSCLCFNSRGGLKSNPKGNVKLEKNNKVKKVIVSSFGRTRIDP